LDVLLVVVQFWTKWRQGLKIMTGN